MRTTTRWLPTPSRTRLESLCWEKSDFSASATASASRTSPSPKAPGASGSIALAVTLAEPLTSTSVAATLPASMSRPTTAPVFFCLVSLIREKRGAAHGARLPLLNRQERAEILTSGREGYSV